VNAANQQLKGGGGGQQLLQLIHNLLIKN